jgi:hypothetical protein
MLSTLIRLSALQIGQPRWQTTSIFDTSVHFIGNVGGILPAKDSPAFLPASNRSVPASEEDGMKSNARIPNTRKGLQSQMIGGRKREKSVVILAQPLHSSPTLGALGRLQVAIPQKVSKYLLPGTRQAKQNDINSNSSIVA